MLETRQASSDEDMLSGDEVDSGSVLGRNEEYAVNFDLPGWYFWPYEYVQTLIFSISGLPNPGLASGSIMNILL